MVSNIDWIRPLHKLTCFKTLSKSSYSVKFFFQTLQYTFCCLDNNIGWFPPQFYVMGRALTVTFSLINLSVFCWHYNLCTKPLKMGAKKKSLIFFALNTSVCTQSCTPHHVDSKLFVIWCRYISPIRRNKTQNRLSYIVYTSLEIVLCASHLTSAAT